MRYVIHQRRMSVEAMQTQAMAMAFINPDKAKEAFDRYINAAVPIPEEIALRRDRERDRLVREVNEMDPIALKNMRFGLPTTQDRNIPHSAIAPEGDRSLHGSFHIPE